VAAEVKVADSRDPERIIRHHTLFRVRSEAQTVPNIDRVLIRILTGHQNVVDKVPNLTGST
jgi:hypothetical protein